MIDYEALVEKGRFEGIEKFVVGAYVCNSEGKILILQRADREFMGGLYEIPSGGVEKGEIFAQALCRELMEETGLELVSIKRYVGFFDYDGEGAKTRQYNFEISCKAGKLVLSVDETTLRIIKEYYN